MYDMDVIKRRESHTALKPVKLLSETNQTIDDLFDDGVTEFLRV
jgi:hypothetical protein